MKDELTALRDNVNNTQNEIEKITNKISELRKELMDKEEEFVTDIAAYFEKLHNVNPHDKILITEKPWLMYNGNKSTPSTFEAFYIGFKKNACGIFLIYADIKKDGTESGHTHAFSFTIDGLVTDFKKA